MLSRRGIYLFAFVLLVAFGIGAYLGLRSPGPTSAVSLASLDVCWERLRKLSVAVERYAADHQGKFPPTLGDLIPNYVQNQDLLRCPISPENKPQVDYGYSPPTATDEAFPRIVIFDQPGAHAEVKRDVFGAVFNRSKFQKISSYPSTTLLALLSAQEKMPVPAPSAPAPSPTKEPSPLPVPTPPVTEATTPPPPPITAALPAKEISPKTADAVELLMTSLTGVEEQAQQEAAKALADLAKKGQTARVSAAIMEALTSQDKVTRERTASALSYLGSDFSPYFLKYLTEGTVKERFSAAMALGKLGNETAGENLRAALRDSDERVRFFTLMSLGDLNYRPAVPEMGAFLHDSAERNRDAAFRGLLNINTKESRKELQKALIDMDVDVKLKQQIADTLGQNNDVSSIPYLVKVVEQNTRVAPMAMASLRKLTGLNIENRPLGWVNWYQQNEKEILKRIEELQSLEASPFPSLSPTPTPVPTAVPTIPSAPPSKTATTPRTLSTPATPPAPAAPFLIPQQPAPQQSMPASGAAQPDNNAPFRVAP